MSKKHSETPIADFITVSGYDGIKDPKSRYPLYAQYFKLLTEEEVKQLRESINLTIQALKANPDKSNLIYMDSLEIAIENKEINNNDDKDV